LLPPHVVREVDFKNSSLYEMISITAPKKFALAKRSRWPANRNWTPQAFIQVSKLKHMIKPVYAPKTSFSLCERHWYIIGII